MKQILIYLLLSLVAFNSLDAQPEFELLLKKPYAKRIEETKKVIDKIANAKIDSAGVFKLIDQYRQFAINSGDKELILEADMLPVYYFKRHSNNNPERFPNSLQYVINKAAKEKILTTQARAMTIRAEHYFKSIGNYELAFEEYFNLEKLIRQIPYESFPDELGIMKDIGEAYFYFSDYPKAIQYLKQAIQFTPIQFNGQGYNLALNSLGLCYQLTGNLDSSDYYFNKLLDKSGPIHREVWESISKGNLGYNLYLRGDYENAKPFFEADISVAEKKHDWGLASGSLIPMAEISFKSKQYGLAEKQLFLAKEYIIRSGQYKRYSNLYPLLSKWYAYKGQLALSSVYLDSAIYVKDSLARKFRLLQLLRSEQKAERLEHLAEIDRIDDERKLKILQRDLLVVSVFALMAIAFYVYRNQRKKHLQQKKIMDLELAGKQKELLAATLQLEIFSKNISEQNVLIETLEKQFGENSNNEALEQIRQVTILTDAEWEQFRMLFAKVHAGYLQRLQLKLPDLTPAEIRFMALAKLGFSNKEMAAMQGVSTNNIRNIWFRLRKKIEIREDASYKELADTV